MYEISTHTNVICLFGIAVTVTYFITELFQDGAVSFRLKAVHRHTTFLKTEWFRLL